MTIDSIRAVATYVIAILVLIGGWWSLVIYDLVLEELVKGAIIGFMSTAIAFVFTQETAKTTAAQTTKALNAPQPNVITPPPGQPTNGEPV